MRRGGRCYCAAAAATFVAACAGSGADGPERISSGASPFAGCRGERAGGFLNAGSEVEPYLAVDPTDGDKLVVAYQQDRWSNGKAQGVVASSSDDGGGDWTKVSLPFSACADRAVPDTRAGDPWVSIGPDGTSYAIAAGDGILVSRSTDGGRTWSSPARLEAGASTWSPDKPSITTHPTRTGVAYAVWARAFFGENAPAVRIDAVLARTDDGGATWSEPRVLVPHRPAGGAISSQILVGPRAGLLYHLALWEERDVPGPGVPARLLVQESTDDGRTWSTPVRPLAVRTAGYTPLGDGGEMVRTGVEAPTFGIDAAGTLFAAWQDSRFSDGRFDQIAFASSRDGGRTWTPPRRVGAGDLAAGVPMIAVADGRLAVAYYTFRLLQAERPPRPIEAQVWVAVSDDEGRTFASSAATDPVVIDDGPQALSTNGQRGVFLGDYMGLAASGGGFVGAYVLPDPSAHDPADVVFFRQE